MTHQWARLCLECYRELANKAPTPGSAQGAPESDDPLFCKVCDIWVNGLEQWEDHHHNKKHKKNVKEGV